MAGRVLVLVWHIDKSLGSDERVQFNKVYRPTAPIYLIKLDATKSLKLDPTLYKLTLFSLNNEHECKGNVGDYSKSMPRSDKVQDYEHVAVFMLKSLEVIEDELREKREKETGVYELFIPQFGNKNSKSS